jgi:hypothetical protein
MVVDGDAAALISIEDVPDSFVGSTIYFLRLENGHWKIESTSGDLPSVESPTGFRSVALEGDLAVAVGSAAPIGTGLFEYLYTFHRTDGRGWEFETVQRVPRVRGAARVGEIQLKDGLLTFAHRLRIFTYERVNGEWERRPNANINPTVVGAPDPEYHVRPTRGDDELVVWTAIPFASGWQVYRWSNRRWVRTQTIGNPQPPQAAQTGEPYLPNEGRDLDAGWFMYGAQPPSSGVGVVIVMKRNHGTGQYEYHSTLRPANSIAGGVDNRDEFGSSLDLDGSRGRLIVGSPESGRSIGGVSGRAYLYEYDQQLDSWEQIERLSYSGNTDHTANTIVTFGRLVALWSNGALVSTPLTIDGNRVDSNGRLHVFEDSFGASYCPGTASSTGPAARLSVSGSNVLPHAGWQLHAEYMPPHSLFTVLISSSTAMVPLPGGQGESICVGGPRVDTGGLRTGGADGSAVVGFDLGDPGIAGVLAGDHRYAQVWFRMPTGAPQPVGLTNAVDVRFE